LIADYFLHFEHFSDATQDYGMISDLLQKAQNLTGPLVKLLKPVREAIGKKCLGDDNSTEEPGQTGY
jgi:hypothetical protein